MWNVTHLPAEVAAHTLLFGALGSMQADYRLGSPEHATGGMPYPQTRYRWHALPPNTLQVACPTPKHATGGMTYTQTRYRWHALPPNTLQNPQNT